MCSACCQIFLRCVSGGHFRRPIHPKIIWKKHEYEFERLPWFDHAHQPRHWFSSPGLRSRQLPALRMASEGGWCTGALLSKAGGVRAHCNGLWVYVGTRLWEAGVGQAAPPPGAFCSLAFLWALYWAFTGKSLEHTTGTNASIKNSYTGVWGPPEQVFKAPPKTGLG